MMFLAATPSIAERAFAANGVPGFDQSGNSRNIAIQVASQNRR
jgi:hypothetical protein